MQFNYPALHEWFLFTAWVLVSLVIGLAGVVFLLRRRIALGIIAVTLAAPGLVAYAVSAVRGRAVAARFHEQAAIQDTRYQTRFAALSTASHYISRHAEGISAPDAHGEIHIVGFSRADIPSSVSSSSRLVVRDGLLCDPDERPYRFFLAPEGSNSFVGPSGHRFTNTMTAYKDYNPRLILADADLQEHVWAVTPQRD